MSNSVRPHRWKPTRLPCPWNSPGNNTGVGCHFLLQCMKVKSESEVAQSCPVLATPWTAAYQAPPAMGFSRQEYWSGVPLRHQIHGFNPWVGKVPWKRVWQLLPVFLPGESQGRGVWLAIVHRIAKSWTCLKSFGMLAPISYQISTITWIMFLVIVLEPQ